MLMVFTFFSQVISTTLVKSLMVWLRLGISNIKEVLMLLNNDVRSLINVASSSLFLTIDHLLVLMHFSAIRMVIMRDTWSEDNLQSGWIKWLSNSLEPFQRNIRLITKFESCLLSEYLIGTWLVGFDSSKLNESAIIKRLSLIEKWWGNDESYKLSQMLKSLVIIRRFQIHTSVSLRYFKAAWDESE